MLMKKEYLKPNVGVFATPLALPYVLCASPDQTASVNDWEEDNSWGSLF